jgi:hypothetical protein
VNALSDNREVQIEEALEHSQTAQAIMRLVKEEAEWKGTPTELHLKLKELWATESGQLPKKPSSLGREVDRVTPVLRKIGISIERVRIDRHSRIRQICIKSAGKLPSPPSPLTAAHSSSASALPESRTSLSSSSPEPAPKAGNWVEEEI